jgi:hypothetical protein
MSLNYIPSLNNTLHLDIFNLTSVPATTNILSSTGILSEDGNPYIQPLFQRWSVLVIYVTLDSAVSIIVKRFQINTAQTISETLPVEIANQPAVHSIIAGSYEQFNFQLSGPASVLKMTVLEPHPTVSSGSSSS